MTDRSNPRLVRQLRLFAAASSLLSIAVGLSGLVGWTFHIPSLETWGAAPVTMKPNTALCFVLMGVSLWLLRRRDSLSADEARRLLSRTAASVVGLVGLLSIAEYLLCWDLGIDQWLAVAPFAEQTGSLRAGLMSPVTAGAFLLLSVALLAIDYRTRRGRWPAQFFSLTAGAAATLGILSFAFDPHVYAPHLSLALPTTVTLTFFSLGLICARTEWGLGALLCSQSLGGSLARRLLPAAFIPVLLGWIRWQITATHLYSEWTVVVLTSLTTMFLLVGLIAWTAVAVDRNDVERRGVEEALAQRTAALGESEGRLAGVIQSAMDSIITVDDQQRIVLFNAAAERMLGCPKAEALGQPITRFIPQRFHAAHAGHIEKFGETGVTNRAMDKMGALWAVRADGQEFQVEASISRIVTGGKKLFTVILRDITERRRAEEQLAEQAEELSRQSQELMRSQQALEGQTLMLQSVLDSMAEGLVAADTQGKFLIWNPAAEKIVGQGAANVPPTEWSKHYGVRMPDAVTPFPDEQNPLARAIRGEASTAVMFVHNPSLNNGVWIEVNGEPLKDKGGVVRGGVVAFRDVTQKRAAEREIQKLNEELEERVIRRTAQLEAANKELEAFTYSVSHDLRAPLRHISGFSKLLAEEYGSTLAPEAQHHLQRIQDGTRRMGLLVDDLLNLARVGRHELQLQVSGLNSVVDSVIAELKPDYEGRQVEWKIGSLPYTECDPSLMRQVFQNLLLNAVKFTRPRTQAVIEVGQNEENGSPVVFVRDNGVGFSMKYADKLFGVFQRLHRPEDFEGTGVGLATVQRIVQKHGGRIWAEAELDKGATFYFTLGDSEKTALKANAVVVGE